MRPIVIRQPPWETGSGVKLTHICTIKSSLGGQRRWPFAHFAVTRVILHQAVRGSGSGTPQKMRRSNVDH